MVRFIPEAVVFDTLTISLMASAALLLLALVALVVLVIRPLLARSGGAMKDRDLS